MTEVMFLVEVATGVYEWKAVSDLEFDDLIVFGPGEPIEYTPETLVWDLGEPHGV